MGKLYLPDTVQSTCGVQCYYLLQSVAHQLSPREILFLKPSLSLSLCCVLTSSMLVIAQVSPESIIYALRIEVIVDLIEGWCCFCRCFIVGTVAVLLLLLLSKVSDNCDISLHCAV